MISRIYWTLKACYWLWHWKRWLHRVYALPQRAALMEITRYRWQVARAYSGCESRLVDTMFEALDLVEKNIRGS